MYLTGSHTWDNLQDLGGSPFDFSGYLTLLQQYHHNFLKLYVWEQPKGITTSPDPTLPNATLSPGIFKRTGPGTAADGALKFDLTQYNQAFFDRLRQRIIAAGNRGMYVSVMLFDGWSVEQKGGGANPWLYHPLNQSNNINGINGDPNHNNGGEETETLANLAVTRLQEAYVKKIVDTVNDLNNVLYEICNETDGGTDHTQWQNYMIDFIHTYEAGKPKQHPVGFTAEYPSGTNAELFASHADWISPNGDGGYDSNPPASTGKKVILTDTDHIWGIGGDRHWAWESFTRGLNVIYMDPWNGDFIPVSPNLDLRVNMGYILSFANRMNLAAMTPRPALCSTGYCLANPVARGAEYLAYLPTGGPVTVNLSATPGTLVVQWFNPANGATIFGGTVNGGGTRSFTPPFSGDAVLYMKSATTIWRRSKSPYDGWILESSEFSNRGGSMNSTAATFSLGDDAANRQYRAILSFNISLPSNAVITFIKLKIKRAGLVGANPFVTLGGIAVDIKKGTFGTVSLQAGDFQAPAGKQAAMQIHNNPLAGGWYLASLGTAANTLLNKTGTTQLRLRFTKDDNNNRTADYLRFYSGNATAADRPVLVIRYYVAIP